MNLRSRRVAWYRWARIDGFGVATLRRLEAVFGNLDAAWQMPLPVFATPGPPQQKPDEALTAALDPSPPCRPAVGWHPPIPPFPTRCGNWIVPLAVVLAGKGSTWAYLNRKQGRGSGGQSHRQ